MDTDMSREKSFGMPQPHFQNTLDKTAAGAHHAVDKLADAASPAIGRVAASAHHAGDRLVSVTAPAAGWVESKARKMNESRVHAVEGSKKYVQNYPFATVAAALAIGMLISYLMKGRSEPR